MVAVILVCHDKRMMTTFHSKKHKTQEDEKKTSAHDNDRGHQTWRAAAIVSIVTLSLLKVL